MNSSVEGCNEQLLVLNTDPRRPVDYGAGLVCDRAVHGGLRFGQAANGQYTVGDAAPAIAGPYRPASFNPELVTFISFGKDANGRPEPGLPVLENHKIETLARTIYDKETAARIAYPAGQIAYRLAKDFTDSHESDLHDEPAEECFVKDIIMIRADKLSVLLPLFRSGLNLGEREYRAALQARPAYESMSIANYKRALLRNGEKLFPVLSACADRLLLET